MRSIACLLVLSSVALAAPAPRPAGGPGAADKRGLRVSITAAETFAADVPVNVRIVVENTSDKPITVSTTMDAFTVDVAWPAPSREGCNQRFTGTGSRSISLAQTNRGQLAAAPTPLDPGKTFELEVDLASWAKVTGKPLGAGAFKAVARHGKLRSKAVGFTVAGTPAAGRCKANPGWELWGPNR